MWATCLPNPSYLGDPRNSDGIERAYPTLVLLGAHLWTFGYITPAVLGVPEMGTESKMAL